MACCPAYVFRDPRQHTHVHRPPPHQVPGTSHPQGHQTRRNKPPLHSPRSIDLRNVQSIAVPTVYVVFALKTTWPPSLHSCNADRMNTESSVPLPCVLTVQSLVRSAGVGTGSRGCLGEATTFGREALAMEASSAAHREEVVRIVRWEWRAVVCEWRSPKRGEAQNLGGDGYSDLLACCELATMEEHRTRLLLSHRRRDALI